MFWAKVEEPETLGWSVTLRGLNVEDQVTTSSEDLGVVQRPVDVWLLLAEVIQDAVGPRWIRQSQRFLARAGDRALCATQPSAMVTTLPKTVTPVCGIAPCVETRDHDDFLSTNRKEDDVGKSAKKGLPDFTLYDWESIGSIP